MLVTLLFVGALLGSCTADLLPPSMLVELNVNEDGTMLGSDLNFHALDELDLENSTHPDLDNIVVPREEAELIVESVADEDLDLKIPDYPVLSLRSYASLVMRSSRHFGYRGGYHSNGGVYGGFGGHSSFGHGHGGHGHYFGTPRYCRTLGYHGHVMFHHRSPYHHGFMRSHRLCRASDDSTPFHCRCAEDDTDLDITVGAATSIPLVIPDLDTNNPGAFVTTTVTVSIDNADQCADGTVRVSVALSLLGPDIEDVNLDLVPPTGDTINVIDETIVDALCGDVDAGTYTITEDPADGDLADYCTGTGSIFRQNIASTDDTESLVIDIANAAGTWTAQFSDLEGGDSSTVTAFALNVECGGAFDDIIVAP